MFALFIETVRRISSQGRIPDFPSPRLFVNTTFRQHDFLSPRLSAKRLFVNTTSCHHDFLSTRLFVCVCVLMFVCVCVCELECVSGCVWGYFFVFFFCVRVTVYVCVYLSVCVCMFDTMFVFVCFVLTQTKTDPLTHTLKREGKFWWLNVVMTKSRVTKCRLVTKNRRTSGTEAFIFIRISYAKCWGDSPLESSCPHKGHSKSMSFRKLWFSTFPPPMLAPCDKIPQSKQKSGRG